jgi:hypothetical protein
MRKLIALILIAISISLATADAASWWQRIAADIANCWGMCKDR